MLTLSQYYFLWPFTVALTIWLKNLNDSFCFSSSLSCLSLSLILCLHLSPTSAVIFWSSSFSFFLSLCLFLLCHFSSFLYLSGLFLLTFFHSHSPSFTLSFYTPWKFQILCFLLEIYGIGSGYGKSSGKAHTLSSNSHSLRRVCRTIRLQNHVCSSQVLPAYSPLSDFWSFPASYLWESPISATEISTTQYTTEIIMNESRDLK